MSVVCVCGAPIILISDNIIEEMSVSVASGTRGIYLQLIEKGFQCLGLCNINDAMIW